MAEFKLFPDGIIPEYSTPEWYLGRDRAYHLEEAPHQGRLSLANMLVRKVMQENEHISSIVDLGAGDGGLLSTLSNDINKWGYDLQPTNIAGAKERGVNVQLANVVEDEIEWGEIAVATEMLEHLVDPHAFVRKIAVHSEWLICSSPYVETDVSHYAFHLWAWDEEGYRQLLSNNGFEPMDHIVDNIFQVLLGRRK